MTGFAEECDCFSEDIEGGAFVHLLHWALTEDGTNPIAAGLRNLNASTAEGQQS